MKEFDEFKNEWKTGRKKEEVMTTDSKSIRVLAKQKKRKSVVAHISTVLVLSITLLVLCLFFYYQAPFTTVLSLSGVALMLGGLALRITIEIYSLIKANKLKLDYSASQSNKQLIDFYNFRTRVHGGFTLTIIALYCIGFYMLTPEFSLYISMKWMIIMDSSFVLIAVILFWQLRKGVIEEKKVLKELAELKAELNRN